MNKFTVFGGSSEVAQALTRKGFRVVETASIGDAASVVRIVAGPHVTTAGQVADYRHNVGEFAERQGMASAIGYWSQDRQCWLVAVTLPPGVEWDAHEVWNWGHEIGCKILHEVEAAEERQAQAQAAAMERWEAERPERERLAAELEAERVRLREEYRPLYEAAVARLPRNRRNQPHGGQLNMVRYWYGCVCREPDHGYGQADRDHALRQLQRAANGGEVAEVVYV